MRMALARVARSFDPAERRRLGAFLGGVVTLHVLGWGALFAYGLSHPAFLALVGVAYTFGIRHAFAADHISAIDNTTRNLLQEGKRHKGIGLFFSPGHSNVVFLTEAVLALPV